MAPTAITDEDRTRAASFVQQGFEIHRGGDLATARRLYLEALSIDPDHFNALQLLGVAALHETNYQDADAWFGRALEVNPRDVGTLLNHAIALQDLKQSMAAIERYQQALQIVPTHAGALHGRGIVLASLGRQLEAMEDFDRALIAQPEFSEALLNRGCLFHQLGQLDRARADLEAAVALEPNEPSALYNLALTYLSLGLAADGLNTLNRVLAIQPDHEFALHYRSQAAWQICDWTDFHERRHHFLNAARTGRAAFNSIQYLALTDNGRDQKLFAEICRTQAIGSVPPTKDSPIKKRPQSKKLRIGYISSDFREHAVAYLTAGLIEAHNRERYEILGIYHGPKNSDAMHRRFAEAFDVFVTLSAVPGPEDAAEVRALDLDVLIDLNGATKGARPRIFAARVASVQINFLGFPGTLWAPDYDYIIVDEYLTPKGYDDFYAEKLIRLPGCFQPNDALRHRSRDSEQRTAWNLPRDGIVFAVFHAPYKLNPDLFHIWLKLLRRLPNSVLWILANDEATQKNLIAEVQRSGVSRDRLVFCGVVPYQRHLDRCALADIVLDTFPFNGGTTTSDVLWAGVPMVTVSGEAFASRMSLSLLSQLGVSELATTSLSEYESMAYRLATDHAFRLEMRRKISDARSSSSLFDSKHFAQKLETALERVMGREGAWNFVEPAHGVLLP